ncbi:uncharacterized protein EAE97_003298 [Botrytis byssoidea]|uniref:Aflatoxin regulatory protein domain-containing protein n=1 Tax=Botrytis byssoidea TaxID=139641 RepID=A0A9P5M1Z5_9HELO|nr:uncharacterized protein EAE97_003298 [Botrytis byssoidea]KAF7949789.1 hypothetical protein EAE97_003298 [Botrytis byssoidea]
MESNNDEKSKAFHPFDINSLRHSRCFGGIENGINNPMHLSNQSIPYPPVASGSQMASVTGNASAERSKLFQGENRASFGYVLQESSPAIEATIDPDPDCLMITPVSTRQNSQNLLDAGYCQCQRGSRTTDNRAGHSRALPLRHVSGSCLPTIAMMLNNSPSERVPINSMGIYTPSKSTLDNRMSISDASDSTIVAPVSIPEQRYFLLNTLYQVCLDATTTYIRALPNTSSTGIRYERNRSYSHRYHPYRGKGRERSYNDDHSKTLMDNIEVISTFLWRKARRDQMAPHRAESDAAMDMNNLYKWGENLVDGMEERARTEGARTAVLNAASAMCEWLRIAEACTLCKEIEGELRGLTNLEMERARQENGEDGDIL